MTTVPTGPTGSASRPQDLAEHVLAASATTGCVVVVSDARGAHLRWANTTLTTNGASRRLTVTVVALVEADDGSRVGSVTGSATTPEQAEAVLRAAEAAAAQAAPAEDANPLLTPAEAGPAGDWDAAPATTGPETYADLAPALGRAFAAASAGERVLYGFVNHEVETTYLASSSGLRLRHSQPTGHLGCTGKSADLSRSAWVGVASRDLGDVDPEAIEAELARRLAWAERSVDLPAGRYDVVLPPSAVADLMVDVYWGAGARDAHEGGSVYSRRGGGTRVGEQVVDPRVSLWSDPAAPDLGSAPFVTASSSGNLSSVFDNGMPLGRTDWIRDGVLTSMLGTRHTSALTGLATTPYVDNLVLEVDGGTGDTADLMAGVERGLLLTCLWYIREVDPQRMLLTGLTRDGVYLVEDGEITAAVNNFRWNESPVELLGRFTHASATVRSFGREWGDDYFSRTATPALRVPDFMMSSVSQAR